LSTIIQVFGNEYFNEKNVGNKNILHKIILADTEENIEKINFPSSNNKILVLNLSTLNTTSFSDFLENFWNKEICESLKNNLKRCIIDIYHDKGIEKVYVDFVETDKKDGILRCVVIPNADLLCTLHLSTPEGANHPLGSNFPIGTVMVSDLPKYMTNNDLTYYIKNYFSKPINPYYINKLIANLSKYINAKGSYLAVAQIPQQNIRGGILKLGLIIGKYPLRRIVVLGTSERDSSIPLSSNKGQVLALNNATYETPEFKKYISGYLGQPITMELIAELKDKLALYGKNHDRLIVDTNRTYLDLPAGEIKIGVIVGKYSKLHIKGNRWFSDEFIQNQLGVKLGREISIADLDNAVAWANRKKAYFKKK